MSVLVEAIKLNHDSASATTNALNIRLSVANSYSHGDREFEKATAMLCPSEIAQCCRMGDDVTTFFGRRATI